MRVSSAGGQPVAVGWGRWCPRHPQWNAAAEQHGWLRIIPKGDSRRLLRAAIRASSEIEAAMSGIGRVPDAALSPTDEPGRADEKTPPALPAADQHRPVQAPAGSDSAGSDAAADTSLDAAEEL